MAQTCTVCCQPNVADIERAIIGGEPLRDIARQYGVSKDAVARHKADHLPRTLAKAQAAQEILRADDLMANLERRRAGLDQLDEDARRIQEDAGRDKNRRDGLDAIRTRTGIARAQTGVDQLVANLTGQLGTTAGPQNILIQVLSMPKIGEDLLALPAGSTTIKVEAHPHRQ